MPCLKKPGMTAMAASLSRLSLAVVVTLMAAAVPVSGWAKDVLRCGWYQNPTPGNHFLTDADGEWVIGLQGGETAAGFDDLPAEAFAFEGRWVAVNGYYGYYGYGCACLRGQFGPVGSEKVIRITGMKPLPLSRCQSDPALPGLGG